MALIQHGSFGSFSVSPIPSAAAKHPALLGIKTLNATNQVARSATPIPVGFAKSATTRGLALKSLKLTEGFEGFLGGLWNQTNELYFVSWAWDLSGEKPFQHPGDGAAPDSCIIPMKVGKVREFLGVGALLFPARPVTAGLALRLMLWESDRGTRDFGKTLQGVSQAISDSKLTNLLELIALGTGVTGATVSLAFQASVELANVIGHILSANSDDYVDYYEGYYPAEGPWSAGEERHSANASEIVLTRW